MEKNSKYQLTGRQFRRVFKSLAWLLVYILLVTRLIGQDYRAIHGSNYAGALGGHNNPAAILNTPYPWDITLFGGQAKYQSKGIKLLNYSLFSPVRESKYQILNGYFSRYGNEQSNLNLVNTRIALGRKKSIGFGVNLKTISNINSNPYNYNDSIESIHEFLAINTESGEFGGTLRSSGVMELYGTFAQQIYEDVDYRLGFGVSLKVNRSLAGARGDITGVQRRAIGEGGTEEFELAGGEFIYGYSANFDEWEKARGQSENIKDFIKHSKTGFTIDAGLELVIKSSSVLFFSDGEEAWYDYDWKFGLSILDLGLANYKYGIESRSGKVPENGVTGRLLDQKFDSTISSLEIFNDSLSTLTPLTELNSDFQMISPARMVLNVDHYLFNDFYINGELSLNLARLFGKNNLMLKNMNLLSITPRWETRKWGIYMPFQYNINNQFWLGAAFKAGPILLGFHNLGNIFSKTRMANGGGYLAITIRPGKTVTSTPRSKYLDCPPH